MESPKKDVTEKIKRVIKESGYFQKDFAKKFGLGASVITQWMSGSRNPSLASLRKIAAATGKPLSYFFENYQEIKEHSNNVTQTVDVVVSHTETALLKKDAEIELLKKNNELLKKDYRITEERQGK